MTRRGSNGGKIQVGRLALFTLRVLPWSPQVARRFRDAGFIHAAGDSVVTKKDIVKRISDEVGLTQLKTKQIVQLTLDAIIQTLVQEGQIELRNFGVFKVKRRAARKARNPRTGAKVTVPAKTVVTFKPGKEMEDLVRSMNPDDLPLLAEAADADESNSRPAASPKRAAARHRA